MINHQDQAGEKPFNELTIFVSNLSEDVWPFIQAMDTAAARQYEIDENANLADLHLFSCADESDLLFVSPVAMSSEFLENYHKLFKPRLIEILVPENHSGQTCYDAIDDASLVKRIFEKAAQYKKITLTSYTASYQFYELKHYLEKGGLPIYCPEAPDDDCAWTVNFFGSKAGIRQLGQMSFHEETDFVLTDGLICSGINDAAQIAADRYLAEDGVVLKTNKGHSGAGVLIFRAGDLPGEYKACVKAIYNRLKKEKYWDMFPIVIEELVNVNYAVAGGFPNVEFKISKSGEIHFRYHCGLRVTKAGVFQGTEISNNVINERYLARIKDLGYFIGERYASEGYRGYFDVDLIAGKDNKIYVSESNTRRTGGTYVYNSLAALLGEDFTDDYFVVHENAYPFPQGKKTTFTGINQALKQAGLLFNTKNKNGVIIASENLLKMNKLAYIVVGKNEKNTAELEAKMHALLPEIK